MWEIELQSPNRNYQFLSINHPEGELFYQTKKIPQARHLPILKFHRYRYINLPFLKEYT